MHIGQLIHDRRKELKLTLEQIGDYVGVGKSTVKKWETGAIANIKRDKIAKLSKILQLNPVVFVKDEEIDYAPDAISDYKTSSPSLESELTLEQRELIDLYVSAPPEIQLTVQTVLKSAEAARKSPDDGEVNK